MGGCELDLPCNPHFYGSAVAIHRLTVPTILMRILVFLVALFSLICQDGIGFHVEEKTEKGSCSCAIPVVADQRGSENRRYCNSSLGEENIANTPFTRPQFWSSDQSPATISNGGKWKTQCRMEMRMVQGHERKTCLEVIGRK